MKPNPLIILATYWNERYFIEPSLRQIEALHPREILIADGCFDPHVPNYSTDGTREIIQQFVKKHPNARMVSPLRPGLFRAAWLLLRAHRYLPWWTIFRPVRWKFLLVSLTKSSYRRNQAITFNYMIGLSQEWKPGVWFMTYDADQFYSDEMIKAMPELLLQTDDSPDLIIGKELTFFGTFQQYTTLYDRRGFSNMPHRIYSDTLIQPTRSMIRETKSRGSLFNFRDILSKHLYIRFARKRDVGDYFHYKLNPSKRFEAGYQLGDRKKPSPERSATKEFRGKHPQIIQENFGV